MGPVGVVLPNDNRSRVGDPAQVPFRWIGRIESTWPDGSQSAGTGVLISGQHILTCAHNFIDHRKQVSVRQATFTPGVSRNAIGAVIEPYPPVLIERFDAPGEYLSSGGPPPPDFINRRDITRYLYDFAVGRLQNPVDGLVGEPLFQPGPIQSAGSFPIANGYLTGYSGDIDNTANTMFHRTGQLRLDFAEEFVTYTMSSYHGDSGSPVYYQRPNAPFLTIVAVHVTGVAPAPGDDGLNFGPALDGGNARRVQDMIQNVDRGRALDLH
jgi:V8-like Glu-specific endopeptidase